jgi:hypothetical protein
MTHRTRPLGPLALGLLAALLPAIALAQAKQPGEQWEMRMKMTMPGMPMAMPEQVTSACRPVRKPTPEDLIPKKDKNCTISDLRQTATKVSFAMTCTGKDAMTGTGEMELLGPDANRGKIHITKMGKEDVDMTQEFSSRKTGTCVYEDPLAKMAAMTAEMCMKEANSVNPAAFMKVGNAESPCKAQQPVLCKKAAPIFAASKTPESFKKNSSEYQLSQLAEVCGLDYAGTRKAACAAGVSARDWSFVAESCPDEARKIAMEECAGRDGTAQRASEYSVICQRFADEFPAANAPKADSPGQEKPASQAAPKTAEEQAVESVQKGLNKLKGMFGR